MSLSTYNNNCHDIYTLISHKILTYVISNIVRDDLPCLLSSIAMSYFLNNRAPIHVKRKTDQLITLY